MNVESNSLQPTLVGDLVTVRPIRFDDWREMYSVASDPAVWALHPVRDRYKAEIFRVFFDEAVRCGSGFSIVDNQTGTVCGSSRYYGLDVGKAEIEIGWTFLGVDYWGGAYNTELKNLMLEHAFGIVDRVIFWVGADNVRSRRAMEKLGARLRSGTHTRALSGDTPYVIYEIERTARG